MQLRNTLHQTRARRKTTAGALAVLRVLRTNCRSARMRRATIRRRAPVPRVERLRRGTLDARVFTEFIVAFTTALLPFTCCAQLVPEQTSDARWQATYVYQNKAPFRALYSGSNSLRPEHERSYSFTTTAYLGLRLWHGGELYVNPEASQGVPLSGL